jgi:hypothetical protein
MRRGFSAKVQYVHRDPIRIGPTITADVCAQTVVLEMRDCTLESASENVKLPEPFFTEDECMNRTALLGRTGLLYETKPEDRMKVVCEHLPSDNNQ